MKRFAAYASPTLGSSENFFAFTHLLNLVDVGRVFLDALLACPACFNGLLQGFQPPVR